MMFKLTAMGYLNISTPKNGILILAKLKGLKSKIILIVQLCFAIKECKIDLSIDI